jgi:cytidylate kinase
MIIAVDGPAASGKGTLGRRLAAHYGLRHLDTGLIYRAVGKAMLEGGHRLDDVERAVRAANALVPATFNETELKRHAVGEAASVVSAIPQVRAALLAFQRDFGRTPPGAVLDGRDIGTVICPDAAIKLFVTASPQARAERRYRELRERGADTIKPRVLAEMAERDRRDSERAAAPLKAAPDAYHLDTSDMDADAAFAAALAFIERKGFRAAGP